VKDFELCIPTKIVFGKNRITEIAGYAKEYGKTLLLVYGMSSIKKSGVYDKVAGALRKEGFKIIEHPGVKSNPVLTHVKKGIDLAKKEKVDFILAVGGGSVVDESKAIAVGACYEGDVWDFFEDKAKIRNALPIITILTISATASEMNNVSVVTNEEKKQKYGFGDDHFYPKVSILDPTVTYTIPANYSAYSGVDVIIHAIEGYFTHEDKWLPIQDRYVEGIVKTVIECTDKILKDPEDYESRATFMWAATLAFNGISTAGVDGASVPNHMFAHILGAHYDIAHGAALSIIVPAWMKYSYKENLSQFVRFSENVFGIKKGNDEETSLAGINALKNWFKGIGAPISFHDANLPTDELDKLADSVIELSELWDIKGYTKEIILDILKLCL
jgi:alcohol dehydrogenase YqhD (iron-dependent ADH family)